MIKTTKIIEIKPYKILCSFNNGELRQLDLESVLSTEDKYVQKILTPDVFSKVKIGEFGQIYWENIAEIKDLNGKSIPCEYDLSPEFVYYNSVSM
jgi:hypothetical protein